MKEKLKSWLASKLMQRAGRVAASTVASVVMVGFQWVDDRTPGTLAESVDPSLLIDFALQLVSYFVLFTIVPKVFGVEKIGEMQEKLQEAGFKVRKDFYYGDKTDAALIEMVNDPDIRIEKARPVSEDGLYADPEDDPAMPRIKKVRRKSLFKPKVGE